MTNDLPHLLREMARKLADRGETELDPHVLMDAAFEIEQHFRLADEVGNYLISTNVNDAGVWETRIFDKQAPRPWLDQQDLRGCFLDYEWCYRDQEEAARSHVEIVKWVSEKQDLGAHYYKTEVKREET